MLQLSSLQLNYILSYIQKQRVMKNYNSLNIINSTQLLKIDSDNKFSIPPGCDKQPIKGIFTLKLKTNYLNVIRESTIIKCRFWGMEGQGIQFTKLSQTQTIINLNIRSNLESLSKYFKDMKILCIQIWNSNNKIYEGHTQTKKNTLQNKQLGWIFINLQRFIINHTLSNFQEIVNIVDMKKQKIGESSAILTLNMYKQQQLYQNNTETKMQQLIPDSKNQLYKQHQPQHQYNPKKIIPNRDTSPSKPIQYENPNNTKINSIAQNISITDKYQIDRQNRRNEAFQNNHFRKKGKAQQYLDQYKKNKPQHTELSQIRNKYGLNNPSIQVMKLKYDEAQLLGTTQKSELKYQERLNILLKSLKVETKNKISYLTIYSEQRNNSLKTETKIILEEQKNQIYQINYLYMLPNHSNDLLIFQLEDSKLEVQIKQLVNLQKLELKNKKNKKIATIEFSLITDKNIENSHLKRQQRQKSKKEKEQYSQKNIKKQNFYINVLNWPQQKIILKNKNFGTAKACKLFFQCQKSEMNEISVDLETQRGQKITLNITVDHPFKQQNFVIKDKSVKIVTSKGQLSQILGLIEKLQPVKNTISQKQSNIKKDFQFQQNESLKNLVLILQKLQTSDNVQCGQLLEYLSNQQHISDRHIKRLQSIIQVQPLLLSKLLQSTFKNNFQTFYSFFHVYHKWNHHYRATQKRIKKIIHNTQFNRNLMKTIKNIKKRGEIIFGVTNTNHFFNQLLHCHRSNQKLHTQNVQDDLDSQQLCHLIVLIFERYFNKSIKISQLQQFCQNQHNLLNLNMHLLNKISTQILEYSDQFKDMLNEHQFSFASLFKKDKITVSQLGLAKLLLGSDQQANSSTLTHSQQNGRKQTQMNQIAEIIKTEQSKQAIKIQENDSLYNERRKHQNDQNQQPKQQKKILIILNKIQLQKQVNIHQLIFFSQKQKIIIPHTQISFPKAIQLQQNIIYNLQIKSNQQIYIATFLASPQYLKIKIYLKDQQIGFLELFSNNSKNKTEESDIVISLTTQQKITDRLQKINEINQQQLNSNHQIINNHLTTAKSDNIKMRIRSIRPTRTNFRLSINNHQNNLIKMINFPDQLQIILPNDDKGWKINLDDQLYEQIVVPNILGSYTYCFVDKNDQKVVYSAIIQIQQNWNPQFALSSQQLLHISINIETIISTKLFDQKIYEINLQYDGQIVQIVTIKNQNITKILKPQTSIMLTKIPEKALITIVDKQKKQTEAQFKFIVKIINKGIDRSERFLISESGYFRLKLSIIQIRHNWQYCKSDRILNLFINPNKKTIQSWLKSTNNLSQDNLKTWIRNTFNITLGQIDILLNDVLASQQQQGFQEFIKLFQTHPFIQIKQIQQIEQEFNIFDLNQTGIISSTQLQLIKRILQKNFKELYNIILQYQRDFETSPHKQNNFIIDLSSHQNQQEFDYLSFLSLFQNHTHPSPPPHPHSHPHPHPPQQHKPKTQSKFISIKLQSFTKLSINGSPCTFLFKINNKSLAQPIHRCYSYSYPFTETFIIPIEINQLEIYCQKLNSEGNWEYRLVQTVQISKQIKILGGIINLQIKDIQEKSEYQHLIPRNHQFNNIEQHEQRFKENQQKNNQNLDFSKSFWNKSLHETKQKWAQSATLSTNKKQARKLADLTQQQMKRKLQAFQRQWQD